MTAADTDVKQVEKMFAVNVFGPMRLVHHLHRMLIAAPRGVIVNIGSIGGVCPYVFGASYNATKAALHHWGNTLRVEMKPFGYVFFFFFLTSFSFQSRHLLVSGFLSLQSCAQKYYNSVHVVNIISGEVATNILKSDVRDNRTLPEDSVYAPLAQLFRDHVNRTPDAMSPDDYARGVVAMVQRRSLPAWFWHGNATGFIWTLDSFFPRTIWVSTLNYLRLVSFSLRYIRTWRTPF